MFTLSAKPLAALKQPLCEPRGHFLPMYFEPLAQLRISPLFPFWESDTIQDMQIIARKTLKQFWAMHDQAEMPLRAWYATVERAQWNGPADVKAMFGTTVDFVGDNRVIFDISGNKYRLIVHIAYRYKRVLIKFVGTHSDYDRIDPETV